MTQRNTFENKKLRILSDYEFEASTPGGQSPAETILAVHRVAVSTRKMSRLI
jgi:hypothetical protein